MEKFLARVKMSKLNFSNGLFEFNERATQYVSLKTSDRNYMKKFFLIIYVSFVICDSIYYISFSYLPNLSNK